MIKQIRMDGMWLLIHYNFIIHENESLDFIKCTEIIKYIRKNIDISSKMTTSSKERQREVMKMKPQKTSKKGKIILLYTKTWILIKKMMQLLKIQLNILRRALKVPRSQQ